MQVPRDGEGRDLAVRRRARRRRTVRRRTRARVRPAAGCRRAGPAARGAPSISPVSAIRIWLRPSYPPVAAFRRRGSPSASAAAHSSTVVRTSRHGATVAPRDLDEVPLGDPVLGADERIPPGPDRDLGIEGLDHGRRHVLQLVRDDRRDVGQPKRRADVVVRAEDDDVRDRGRRAVGIGVQDRHAVAHRAGGLAEHPSELTAAEDADRRRRIDRAALHPEAAMHVRDPGLLPVRVLEARVMATGDDLGLECGVGRDQLRVGEQRVAEREVADDFVAAWLDVQVDPEERPVHDQRADEHRARRRERVLAGLRPEPQAEQHLGHHRHVFRVRSR